MKTKDDLIILSQAQRIRMEVRMDESRVPTEEETGVLAEAQRILNDEDRSTSARKNMRKGRKADVFAGEGSVAGKLKARREKMEEGDPEGARDVFIK